MHFAEFGVVMKLFLMGLELEPAMLWRLRAPILGLGGLQVAVTSAVVAAVVAAVAVVAGEPSPPGHRRHPDALALSVPRHATEARNGRAAPEPSALHRHRARRRGGTVAASPSSRPAPLRLRNTL
jgi:hypothetical protein